MKLEHFLAWLGVKVSRRASIDRYYLLRLGDFAVFLHRFKRDDRTDTFHTHPWTWLSLIFGCYDDQRIGGKPRRRWLVNWCRADVAHRVTLPRGPVWTLLIHGPRCVNWRVFDANGRLLEIEPWRGVGNVARREYVEERP